MVVWGCEYNSPTPKP